jgi:uncharacterized repeat protein (TIGR04138 family)
MQEKNFLHVVKTICEKDPRYDREAYAFIREALDFTIKLLSRENREGTARHVSGQELLDGIRSYALQEFGPMTLSVLQTWGIRTTRDFGEIVFNMVESGMLGRTEKDRREDFDNGYDFFEAFGRPFVPRTPPRVRPPTRRNASKKRG